MGRHRPGHRRHPADAGRLAAADPGHRPAAGRAAVPHRLAAAAPPPVAVRAHRARGECAALGALHHPDDRADPGDAGADGHLAGRARRDPAAGGRRRAVLRAAGRDGAARGRPRRDRGQPGHGRHHRAAGVQGAAARSAAGADRRRHGHHHCPDRLHRHGRRDRFGRPRRPGVPRRLPAFAHRCGPGHGGAAAGAGAAAADAGRHGAFPAKPRAGQAPHLRASPPAALEYR